MRSKPEYDLISMGRACLDLYANEIGVPFAQVENFAAYVGGCPANIAVGARRLGLEVAMCSAVGADPVGDFVLRFLGQEGIDARYVTRKSGFRTGAAALAIMPPDTFPLIYYRENAADIQLSIDDVLAVPLDQAKALLISGTGLSKEPSRSATLLAAEAAQAVGTRVILDLDLRTDQWHDPRAYGVTMRTALPSVDVVIGTEDEIKAVDLREAGQMSVRDGQVSSADVAGDLDAAIERVLGLQADGGGGTRGPAPTMQEGESVQGLRPELVEGPILVVKRGREGASVHQPGQEPLGVPGYPVEILNTLGAGDAFAAGFIYGLTQGWGLYKAARLGNACGAIVVTRHACANSMPTMDEVTAFVEGQGGW